MSSKSGLFQNFLHKLVGARGASSSLQFPQQQQQQQQYYYYAQPQPDDSSSSSSPSAGAAANTTMSSAQPRWWSMSSPTRSSTATTNHNSNNLNMKKQKLPNFGQVYDAQRAPLEIAQHQMVFFGEIHSQPAIVAFQTMVQQEMARYHNDNNDKNQNKDNDENNNENIVPTTSTANSGRGRGVLHVVFEHFSFDMQHLLDDYQAGKLSFDELVDRYYDIGTENHDLEPYRVLLEDAKRLNNKDEDSDADTGNKGTMRRKIQLHAGFLSRSFARLLMKEGPVKTLQEAAAWLPPQIAPPDLQGSELHYNAFESLITGRSIRSINSPSSTASTALSSPLATTMAEPKQDRFRRIFPAQILKDVAMSHKIHTILASDEYNPALDKILVLAGNGHILGYCGVPERVLQQHPDLTADTCVILSHHYGSDLTTDDDANGEPWKMKQELEEAALGPNQASLADYLYVYQTLDDEDDDGNNSISSSNDNKGNDDAVRLETTKAYDKVGESAHLKGNATKAIAIMTSMGYSKDDIDVAGSDVYNFQGVGNPHIFANIQPGETVLDVGSGLGIDSMIAHHRATSKSSTSSSTKGFVIGIDISEKEVRHAQSCAKQRQIDDKLRFSVADMEKIPLPDNSVDVVISNGAFCLAPDKEKAFAEVFRVLKPGGRISICTTTTRDESKLEPGISWPICMKMFIPQTDIRPMCEKIGFEHVLVDDSDSSMCMELPAEVLLEEEEEENENKQKAHNSPSAKRNKVHVGSAEFRHLEDFDMDAICARVCVVARKPKETST